MVIGRPTDYTDEKAKEICALLASGMSLIKICQRDDMPNRVTVYRWLLNNSDFSDQYTRAREEQADFYADEITDIADTEEDPQKARVRIDARKWVASKLKPKKYGDRLDVTSGGEKLQLPPWVRDKDA